MTSPPQIIQVPGTGQEIAQSLAPLIQVLQNRAALQQQALQHEQETAAQIFAHGMQTEGFETTDAAKILETKMGVPGLGASIAKARTNERNRQVKDITDYVNGQDISPVEKQALTGSMILSLKGATAEVSNQFYQSMVGGKSLEALEKARLDHMQAETQKLQLDVNSAPTPEDQLKAAKILNVKPELFDHGVNYVGVLESIMKEQARDASQNTPERTIVNASLRVMSDLHDFYGTPSQTPDQALDLVLNTFQPLFPETVAKFAKSPEHIAALQAARDARIAWGNARDANYVQKDSTGKVVKDFKDRATYGEYLLKSLHARYPMIPDNNLRTTLNIVEQSVFSPKIP